MMEDLCRRYQDSFGESDIPDEVTEHALSCASCQEFQRRQQTLRKALPAWKTPEFSPDFASKVMSRVNQEASGQRSLSDVLAEIFHFRLAIPLPIGAIAGILLVCSMALNVFLWSQRRPDREMIAPAQTIVQTNIPTPAMIATKGTGMPIPREWVGSGAFLVIPLVNPEKPLPDDDDVNHSETNGSHDI